MSGQSLTDEEIEELKTLAKRRRQRVLAEEWEQVKRIARSHADREAAESDVGLYAKYTVVKNYDPEGKHDDCMFFVLDVDHDPHAVPALLAYAASVRDSNPELASDLDRLAGEAHVRLHHP